MQLFRESALIVPVSDLLFRGEYVVSYEEKLATWETSGTGFLAD